MSTRRAALLLALLALVALYGFGRRRSGRGPEALRVEYAGCAAVLAGPTCVPAATGELTVWLAAPEGEPRVSGARALGPSVPVQGGRRLRLALDPRAERVQIEAGSSGFTLALAREQPPDWAGELRALLGSGQADRAADLLRRHLDTGPAAEQGRTLAALARVELRRGHPSEAADLLRRALADHRVRGRLLDLVNDATVLVFTLLFQQREFDEARALLSSLPATDAASGEARYYVDYYGGLLALTTGDLRSALRALGDACRRAERLGLTRLARTAEQVLAEPLQLLGRRGEAEQLLERLRREAPSDLPPCERAQLLNALGWNRLLVRELDERGPDPLPVLEQARLALAEGAGCPHLADEPRNVGLNLALAHLQAGDTRAARADLREAPASAAPPLHLVLWQREIEARLDLREGQPRRALAGYQRLGRLAEATLAWGTRWRAAVGAAQAWRALERPAEALSAYAEAELRLDQDTLQVPLQEGRESFVAGHESATRSHLELLLEQGRDAEAWALARRSRARILSGLRRGERLAGLSADERREWDKALSEYRAERDALGAASAEDWKLAADRLAQVSDARQATRRKLDALLDRAFALLDHGRAGDLAGREPLPGELLLGFHPLPHGEVGFAADAQGLVALRLDCLSQSRPPDELGACLLGPFAARLRGAQKITLMPFGAFGDLDLHALPFEGAPLLAGRDVGWSLDLAARPLPSAPGPGTALLVGDPRGDLPGARRELEVVAGLLRQAGQPWRVDTLQGAAASHAEVQRRLAQADLFHFAGHGRFTGRGGWESELPLSGASALGLGDILALERAPRFAVLSGCETGRSSNEAAQSLGLAQAFLSRGTQAVLAASRPVDDVTAGALVERFYRNWSAGQAPALALRRAQLELRRSDARADWAAFRLLEP